MLYKKYSYYVNDGVYVGYLEEFPDYMTQGYSLEELEENLLDIYDEVAGDKSGWIPNVQHVGKIAVA